MKKIIRQVSNGIVQITTVDERWYQQGDLFVPSVTWIAGHYPKGIGFYKWLADKGWDEAESIKSAAGDKGSKVHNAIVDLIDGKEVQMDDKYLNNSTEQEEELSLEEYQCLMSFTDWFKAIKPKVLAREIVIFSKEYNYAGTVDLICRIGKDVWVIDFKTSQYVWPEFELQVSAYKHATKIKGVRNIKVGVLQLGYKRNKNAYKFTEVEDKFELFLSAQKIWANENKGVEPKQKDYPTSLSIKQELNAKTPKQNATNNKQVIKKVSQHPIRRQRKIQSSVQRKAQPVVG